MNVWLSTPFTTGLLLLLLPLLLGLLTRLALPHDGRTGTDRVLFGVICALWLGMNQTVREIVKEKHILLRETFAGVNCALYLLSKLGFFLLVGAAQALALVAPIVWLRVEGFSVMLSLTDVNCSVVLIWLMLWLGLLVGASLGVLISAGSLFLRAKGEVVAVLLVVLVMLPQILFSDKVLPGLVSQSSDYHAFIINDETRAVAEVASYLTVSRYLYLPLAATIRGKEAIPSIFVFNITILSVVVLICSVLTWLTLELFIWRQRRQTHA